uniref:Putative secreted protein n=1 Tax=Anopheles marajoara TaxID=58244 RepID=A0A2M4CAW2_9DIPT
MLLVRFLSRCAWWKSFVRGWPLALWCECGALRVLAKIIMSNKGKLQDDQSSYKKIYVRFKASKCLCWRTDGDGNHFRGVTKTVQHHVYLK